MKKLNLELCLIALLVFSAFVSTNYTEPFKHFVLPRVLVSPEGGDQPFLNHPKLGLQLLNESTFLSNLEEEKFFLKNQAKFEFSSIYPASLKMYDSLAQSKNKIFILLTGTLWQKSSIDSLKTMVELAKYYSELELNEERLLQSAEEWFLGHLKNENTKISYFLPANILNIISDQIDLVKNVTFKSHVAFAYLHAGGYMLDPLEWFKEIGLQVPFVFDEQADESLQYIYTRTPSMTIVDRQGQIIYKGPPLAMVELKTKIDYLLLPIYEQTGLELAQENHQKRVQKVEYLREQELARRQDLARKATSSKSHRGDAFKSRQSEDPAVVVVSVKDLNFH